MGTVLTISAVNAATDQLTVTAHGLVTGAGPVAVYAASGSGGVIPGGLAAVTDYWVIVSDANTIKLASSSANALAGTAIDITSTGTLPLSLLVALPYRRATTYVAGSQLKSADLDSMQDNQIALWNLLTAQAQALYNAVSLAVALNANAGVVVPTGQNIQLNGTATIKRSGTRTIPISPHKFIGATTGGQAPTYLQALTTSLRTDFVCSASPIGATCDIDGLYFGERIVNVRFFIKDVNGQPALLCSLVGGDRAGSGTANAVTGTSAAGGTTQTITLTGVNHIVGTTTPGPVVLAVRTALNATGTYSIFGVELDVDIP